MSEITTMTALNAFHRGELEKESAIDPEVIRERGYVTVGRPLSSGGFVQQIPGVPASFGTTTRQILSRLGFPSWAIREDYYFPGLWIPGFSPRGDRYAGQWKPKAPVRNRDGKPMKYTSAKGSASRLDVHPRWSKDAGGMELPAILDVSKRLWITEGVKKADSLTSKGEVTVALSGVFNWRNSLGGLGDWEDVRIRDREVVICFDADTIVKPQVQLAMVRLGKWLKQAKRAKSIIYCVVPGEVNGQGVKGVDDFFAAGGSVKALEQNAFDKKPPQVANTEDFFTDARLAETLASEVLDGAYVWAAGLEWLAFDGRVWNEVHEVTVIEAVRQWAVNHFAEAADELKKMKPGAEIAVDGWRGLLSKNRASSVLSLARGIVERKAEHFDADPDLLNTPSGVFNFTTGELMPHDPDLLMTKMTSGSYRPGYTHPDWDRALEVLPPDVMTWFQVRIGQAITGHTTVDGIVPILKGGGENGKGLLMTDGLLPALGGYATPASPKLFMSARNEHSTERADLRGSRLVIAEELTEGRSIDVTALKQVADVGRIKARRTHKDNMEFDASHSLFATTNYTPVINETDHGTWRRLALVVFPWTYVKRTEEKTTLEEGERWGDPNLKARIKANKDGQHDAAVTWAIEGARRLYAAQDAEISPMVLPARVAEDTLLWRKEADRIFGFWEEVIEPAEGHAVLTSELLDAFNGWLRGHNHSPWSKETFGPRFGDHVETKKNRVASKKIRTTSASAPVVVRRQVFPPPKAVGATANVWVGVRWRSEDETS